MSQILSTQPQGTLHRLSEATSGCQAQGQTLHLVRSSSSWGAPPTAPATGRQACPSSVSQPIIVALQATASIPLAPVMPATLEPSLAPHRLVVRLPVFCQCSNPCLPPGLHLPAPRTRRDHLRDQECLPTARLYPSAIGFRGCLSALCSPILAVSSADWPSCNQLERANDPSRGSLGECARRSRGDWRRRRRRRRVPAGERARGAQGGAGVGGPVPLGPNQGETRPCHGSQGGDGRGGVVTAASQGQREVRAPQFPTPSVWCPLRALTAGSEPLIVSPRTSDTASLPVGTPPTYT